MCENAEIIIMGDNNLESVGGEQESTKIIIESLKKEFKIAVIQPGQIINQQKNVKYFHLTNITRIKHLVINPILFVAYINSTRKIIKNTQPKIIHTQAQISFFIVSLLRKLKLIPIEIKLIHTERGLYNKYNAFFKEIFFFFFKELDILVTTTEYNKKDWEIALNKKDIKIKHELIENTAGAFFEKYDSILENSSNVIKVGFVGRYTNWKNWPLAEEIVRELNSKTKGNIIIKMAVGCLDNQALKETNTMFRRMENVIGNNFEGEINIGIEEMNEFYYDIDFFILTSKENTESFGRTLVEAMSRKNIVLTTNAGGAVEVVGNNDRVFKNAEDCVEKIVSIFNNKDFFYSEKELNYKRVHSNYSLENNRKKHELLYINAINNQ